MLTHVFSRSARRTTFAIASIVLVSTVVLLSFTTTASGQTSVEDPDVELGPATMVGPDADREAWAPFDEFRGPEDDEGHKEGHKDKDGQRDGQAEECWTWDESELGFFERLNEERRRRGVGTVKLDPELSRVAQNHSYHMKTEQRLYHTPEDKLRERVTNWELLGENVGRGGDVDSLHRAFMESEAHRHVALHREFNYVGIGVSHQEGILWVTILMEGQDDPGTTMEMSPSC